MKRFKIFVGRDYYNRLPVYQVIDKVGDYVGEFHKSRKDAQEELKDLMRSMRKNPMKHKTRKRIVRRKRRVVRRIRRNEPMGYTSYIPADGFLVATQTGFYDTPNGKFANLKRGQVLRILFTTKARRGGGTTGKEYFIVETMDGAYEGLRVLIEKKYAGRIYESDPLKGRYGRGLVGNPMRDGVFASGDGFDIKDFSANSRGELPRIQMHPGTDLWMRGARFGEILKIGRKNLLVKLDKLNRPVIVSPRNIGEIIE